MVTTQDSTSPFPDRMGVAFTKVVTLRPSGTSMTISSARTVSPSISSLAMSNGEIFRPSARR